MRNAGFSDEHFSLYRRYINARHADGNMTNPLPEDYREFLYSDWSDTFFLEFREESRLLAVAVCDRVNSGLSAVYSYYDPYTPNRSLGTYCVLQMIEQARQMEFDYLYLGYLIHQSQKMSYKQLFRPLEVLIGSRWQDHDRSVIHAAL
jgi:arginine-tRNA-protein transferase